MTDLPNFPAPTWFVGCGNMGQAMIGGWRSAGIDLSNAVVIRPSGAAVEGVRTVASFADAGPQPRLVILAVKPQKLAEVTAQLRPWLTSKAVIVSLLAGVDLATLRKHFPKAAAIVRAMPNLGVSIRRGVIALASDDADDALRVQLSSLLAPLGYAPWMIDEARFAAVGAVAGAGPAYVARFVAALTKAGEKRGLSPEMASTIALETVLGTAWMAATTGEDMDSVAQRVASPKGTTEAGLAVLDRDQVLNALLAAAIDAASQRGGELADEARSASLAADAQLS
ncbi:MAG: pyrroline-5-carboxylate reductase dimerization domain-containing protein [Pseudomonadota bacterium]